PNVHLSTSLEDAAAEAVTRARGTPLGKSERGGDEASLAAIIERETKRMAKSQRWLRGYFTGGTLADEAMILLHRLTGAVHSNNQTDPAFVLKDPRTSTGHTIVD